jgi:hypothetical protein
MKKSNASKNSAKINSLKIELPKSLTFGNLIETFKENGAFGKTWESISLTIPEKCHIFMNAMAFICSWGLLQKKEGRSISFEGNTDVLNYISRMDMFRHLGFGYKEEFQRFTETGRFIPLRLVDGDDDVMSTVNAICDLVVPQFDNARDFIPAFEWAIYEVIDNIILHAETPVPGVVCAQYYPEKNIIDVAVCDMGRGIKKSLSESYKLESHELAIAKALERGATRNKGVGQGNGLAGTFEIAKLNEGSFRIWSGDATFKLSPRMTEGEFEKLSGVIPGTGVNLRLNTNKPVPMNKTFMGKNSWTYIEKESERVCENGLKVLEECNYTGGRRPARYMRIKIENILPDMEDVLRIDFSEVKSCSSSFLDELLGRLIADIGPASFRAKINIVNASDEILDMANVVIHQRLETGNQ